MCGACRGLCGGPKAGRPNRNVAWKKRRLAQRKPKRQTPARPPAYAAPRGAGRPRPLRVPSNHGSMRWGRAPLGGRGAARALWGVPQMAPPLSKLMERLIRRLAEPAPRLLGSHGRPRLAAGPARAQSPPEASRPWPPDPRIPARSMRRNAVGHVLRVAHATPSKSPRASWEKGGRRGVTNGRASERESCLRCLYLAGGRTRDPWQINGHPSRPPQCIRMQELSAIARPVRGSKSVGMRVVNPKPRKGNRRRRMGKEETAPKPTRSRLAPFRLAGGWTPRWLSLLGPAAAERHPHKIGARPRGCVGVPLDCGGFRFARTFRFQRPVRARNALGQSMRATLFGTLGCGRCGWRRRDRTFKAGGAGE